MGKEENKKILPRYWNEQLYLRLLQIEWHSVDQINPAMIHDDKAREMYEEFLKKFQSLMKYVLSSGEAYDTNRRSNDSK